MNWDCKISKLRLNPWADEMNVPVIQKSDTIFISKWFLKELLLCENYKSKFWVHLSKEYEYTVLTFYSFMSMVGSTITSVFKLSR